MGACLLTQELWFYLLLHKHGYDQTQWEASSSFLKIDFHLHSSFFFTAIKLAQITAFLPRADILLVSLNRDITDMKWSEVKVKVAQSCPTLCDPMDLLHEILQARVLEWVAFPFSRGSSQPRDKPRSPTLQADSLPAEPEGKPQNTGVGSLSLLQWIFPTQESNQVLLRCRWILYQLSYEGSPYNWHITL